MVYSMAQWSLRYAWDVTVTDTVAPSYVRISSAFADSAPEAAVKRKERKSSTLKSPAIILSFPLIASRNSLHPRTSRRYINYLLTYLLNQVGTVLCAQGHRFSSITDDPQTHDPRFLFFLLQINSLMMSASPIHSVILMWKCNVTSRFT